MRSCQVGWLIMAHFMSNVWSSQDYEKFVCPDGSQALSVRTPTAVTRLSLSAQSGANCRNRANIKWDKRTKILREEDV